jgi:hypothetical protein
MFLDRLHSCKAYDIAALTILKADLLAQDDDNYSAIFGTYYTLNSSKAHFQPGDAMQAVDEAWHLLVLRAVGVGRGV